MPIEPPDRTSPVPDLALLCSFPRSGSNFLQNIVRLNTRPRAVLCSSIYGYSSQNAQEQARTGKAFFKTHACDQAQLDTELAQLWNMGGRAYRHILLVRDPRDVMISLYDYILGHRGVRLAPEHFLDTDFYWYLFKPDVLTVLRDENHARPLTVLEAYRLWVRTWFGGKGAQACCRLSYEHLLEQPQQGFAQVFDVLAQPMPDPLSGLSELVAQYGESQRLRGKAQGWRLAEDLYRPIIEQVESRLAEEIRILGYA